MMKLLWQLLLLSAFIYSTFLIFLYFLQKKLIFFPVQTQHPLSPEGTTEFVLKRSGAVLRGWLLNEQFASSRMLLYYGGSSEDIYFSREQFSSLVDTAVLLVNYRGYGTSTGTPGEREFYADALAVVDQVNTHYAPSVLVLMGKSLGSAIAGYVASRRSASALILVTPFDSLESVAKKRYPFLPVSLLLRHPFRTAQHLKDVDIPTLILYGGRDRIIPAAATERLLTHLHMQKKVVCVEEAEHNTIDLYDEYQLALLQFLLTIEAQRQTLDDQENQR